MHPGERLRPPELLAAERAAGKALERRAVAPAVDVLEMILGAPHLAIHRGLDDRDFKGKAGRQGHVLPPHEGAIVRENARGDIEVVAGALPSVEQQVGGVDGNAAPGEPLAHEVVRRQHIIPVQLCVVGIEKRILPEMVRRRVDENGQVGHYAGGLPVRRKVWLKPGQKYDR